MTRIVLLFAALFSTLALLSGTAAAQDNNDADKSRLTRFVESKLSAENRQISLNNIEGALSSDARIGEIAIADRQGVWLRIVNARLVWTRRALLFGRLEIDSLTADKIEVLRKPLPAEGAPAPSSGGFSLPQLPVSVSLEKLSVPEVSFGPTVFGLESRISVNGNITLADGTLDTTLDIERLDGPGGTLHLAANYVDESKKLDLDLKLDEPENGVLANLLKIEGKPAVSFALKGAGPVSDLTLDMTLDADGTRAVTGTASLTQTDAGLSVTTDVHGPVSNLVAPAFRDFFGANTALQAKALVREGGGLTIDTLTLDSGALSLKARAKTTADNFLETLTLDASIKSADDAPVVLPVSADGDTRVGAVSLAVDFGTGGGERWSGSLAVDALKTPTLGIDNVDLKLGGLLSGVDTPDDRRITFDVSGAVTGIETADENVREALGDRIDLAVEGGWRTGQPVMIDSTSLTANALELTLAGQIADTIFDGTIGIKASSLAPFAGLAKRPLAGSIDLNTKGKVKPLSGGFDLVFDGSGTGLQTGTKALDALLKSRVDLSGRLARTDDGFEATDFAIRNDQVSIEADGVYAPDKADFDLDIALSDLALVTDRASGRVTLSGNVAGNSREMSLNLTGGVASGKLSGRTLKDAEIAFDGNLLGIDPTTGKAYGSGVSGKISGSAFLSGERVSLASAILVTPDEKRLSNFDFQAGGTHLSGSIDQDARGLLTGDIVLDAADISTAAALATLDASGSANATVALTKTDGVQNAKVEGDLSDIAVQSIRLGRAYISATALDLFGVPKVDGSLSARSVVAGGIEVTQLSASARNEGKKTAFKADASLANGTDASVAGSLEQIDAGFRVGLDALQLMQKGTTARLVEPATVTVEGQTIDLGMIQLDIDGGTIEASGRVADTLDLSLAIDSLPLSIANTIKPDLAVGGTVSGTATVGGTKAEPEVDFDISADSVTARPVQDAGLPAFDIAAKGNTAGKQVTIDARLTAGDDISLAAKGAVPLDDGALDLTATIDRFPLAALNGVVKGQNFAGALSGKADVGGTIKAPRVEFQAQGRGISAAPLQNAGVTPLQLDTNGRYDGSSVSISSLTISNSQGVSVSANGTVPLAGSGSIDVNATVDRFPLATLNGVVKGQDLAGSISAQADVGGTIEAPRVAFEASGSGISAAPLRNFGVAPLQLDTSGRYDTSGVSVSSLTVSNSQGLSVSASGDVPLSGGGLNLRVQGRAPLSIANRTLAERGTRVSGTTEFSVTVGGTLTDPDIGGMVSASGVNVVDPGANIRFNGISLLASVGNKRVTINRFTAPLASGGTIVVGGSVSIDPATNFASDLTIALNQARYSDGDFITTTASGRLTVTGALLRDPVIGGRIDIARAEIGIPSNVGGGAGLTDIRHVNTPADVQATLNRARIKAGGAPVPTSRPSVVRLDVTVSAPRRIFIRGRGLDAELGGQLRVTGPVTSVSAVGSFDLIRGRLSIVGKRIDFDSGSVTLTGSLDPVINFVASSQAGDATVTIRVTGRASDPDIDFSSQPALPQDEVLAKLIFGRSISDLSGFQIAQLAAAVAELAGGQNTSLLGQLRKSTGLDDLDLTTDSQGNASVRAGRYIRDNVYLGVEAGAGGKTEVNVNIDITKNLKGKASAGTQGDSTVGLFYEKDY